MFCTKCGTNNEDNNAFCKNCGAKLVKPAVNSPVPSSSGVAQAAKAVNVKLIAGIAVALVVVVTSVVGLTNRNKSKDINDDAKATAVMEHAETIQTTVVTVDESNDAVGNSEESSKQLYSVTAEQISNDIASFQHCIVDGMYSVSDEFYIDVKIRLEDALKMTSVNRSNVSFVDIYSSNPKMIVADSADIKNMDEFVAFCGDPYKKVQSDIRKGSKSVSECYYDVVVEDSNINGEYKYYDGEAEKVYIKVRFLNEKFVDESWMFEMVQATSDPAKWLINDCWCVYASDDYDLAYKLPSADKSEEVSYPDWFIAYKNFAGDTKVAFIGEDSNGTPYMMMKESNGLYLYNGDSINKVEIKGVDLGSSAKYGGAFYNCWINQLEFFIYAPEHSYDCIMDLSTGRILYSVALLNGVRNGYFDGDGKEIAESVYLRENYLFNGRVPFSDDPLCGADAMQEYIESVYGAKEVDNKNVVFNPVILAFSSYLSDYGLRSRTKDAKNLEITGSDPVWVSEYRQISDGIMKYVALIGKDSSDIPYLVCHDYGYALYLYSEDAGVVEVFNDDNAGNIWYNPDINKVLISYSHNVDVKEGNVIYKDTKYIGYYLYDLYSSTIEMVLDKCDMRDEFSINGSSVTYEEWNQKCSDIGSDFWAENKHKYEVDSCDSIDSAYRAWLSVNTESSENAVSDSEWLEAYKNAYARNNEGNKYCFIGQSNTGVPYLAKAWGGLDYYNGSEVVSLCYSQNIEYNPVTNKVYEYSHTSLSNGGGDNFYLIDLNIGEVELSCAEVTEDWDTGIVKYYGDNGEVSEEEYIRISDEMSKRFGDGGNIIETWYDSVELAYRAYNIKRGSISASASASAANASEPADTALATDNTSASEYVLKDSSSRYLTKDDLQGLSADDCRIARNEIYARHGRKFDDEGLQSHFNSCSWYRGTIEPGDFQETMLSDIEVANKNLIVEYEKEMGYR